MNLRSVLCAATLLAAAGVAQAFPDYTMYPEDGAEFNSAMNLGSINLTFTGVNVEVKDTAYALLQDEEGEDIESTKFVNFMNSGTIIIGFDSSEILTNGEWTLFIPEGQMTANGEDNPAIYATYTLNDPNLGIGEYPQIELVSVTPEEGTKIAVWGGDSLTKVELKTSDDAAVNYIEWSLYDVTDGESYVRSGNDNRYDFNRYKHHDDIWTNGLFIAVGGETGDKLILGHEYRLDLRFCGIGYDDATNQYPTPQQIEASTELETSVTYYGLSEPPEYAKATYEAVSPNPDEYEIETPAQARFDITYSAPAKPTAFTYALGSGAGTATAGIWEPYEGMEADADGLCTRWTFIISESVVKNVIGSLTVNIQSKDADGLFVKGNGDMIYDDYNYSITWDCNCGAPTLISVSPADQAEVESLSSITISNEKDSRNYVMACYDGISTSARILDMNREEVRQLGRPVFSDDNLEATWTFEPITKAGTYILQIPKWYFNLGEEMEASLSNQTEFRYYIVNNTTSGPSYDLLPTKIDPANNAVVESISDVKLTFADVTFTPLEDVPEGKLYKVVDGEDVLVEGVVAVDNDFFNPTAYTYSFKKVTEAGLYKVVIPQGTFFDEEYDYSMGESGNASPEIVLNYTIEGAPAPVVYTLVPEDVTPADGSEVEEIRMITIEFGQTALIPTTGSDMVATLYKVVDGEDVYVSEADPLDNPESDWFNPTIYDFYVSAYEAGEYKLVIPQGMFYDEAYAESDGKTGAMNPELVYNYTIIELPPVEYDLMPINITPANDSEVSSLDVITITFDESAYVAQVETGAFSVSFAKAEVYRQTEVGDVLVAEVVPVDNPESNYLSPTIYDIDIEKALEEAITEEGNYIVALPKGAFGNQTYMDSNMRTGSATPQIVLAYVVSSGTGVAAILDGAESINVYDVNGVQVLKDANVEAAKELKAGMYIINGKKVMIRK